jgi:hypothetical protein
VAASVGEQLPEDGPVSPKHVAIECDFNAVFYVHLTAMGICCADHVTPSIS